MWLRIAATVAVLTVSLPLPEFVELQRMTDDGVRARFELSEDCRPRLTALADPPGRVLVLVTCDGPAPDAAVSEHPTDHAAGGQSVHAAGGRSQYPPRR